MSFLGSTVVVVAMAVVSACIGALGFLIARLDLDTSAILAIASFVVLVVVQFASWRGEDRRVAAKGLDDIGRAIERLTRDVALLGNRVSALETAGAATAASDAAALKADVAGIQRQLDEITLALTEQGEAVTGLLREGVAALPSVALSQPSEEPQRARGRFGHLTAAERIAIVAGAIEAGRMEILLQPVVTLPQRKIRWYELSVRLKSDRGDTLLPEDFRPIAEEGGLAARLDEVVLFRAVQLVRRLQARNREVGLMVDIGAATLSDGDRFRAIAEFMGANTAIAGSVVIEVAQGAWKRFGPLEYEALAALTRSGFKLSIDGATDLRLDARDLADRAVRFVKVPADVLLGRAGSLPADIHPADLADLLARYGIDLVADRIDAESTVVDLLDYDVRFGQGLLFSPPRPVRAEILGDPDQAPADRRSAAT